MTGPVSRDSESNLSESLSEPKEFFHRFVILRHDAGPDLVRTTSPHLDWMFETGNALSTWSTDLVSTFDRSFALPCSVLADHRLVYLNREGDLGNGRGSVKQIIAGEFRPLEVNPAGCLFKAVLRWHDHRGLCFARLEIGQRAVDSDCGRAESRSVCGLRFSVGR